MYTGKSFSRFATIIAALLILLTVASTDSFAAKRADCDSQTQGEIKAKDRPSGKYLKIYAGQFTIGMKLSGWKPGAFAISENVKEDGFYHFTVDVDEDGTIKQLVLKYGAKKKRLRLSCATLGGERVYPKPKDVAASIERWHKMADERAKRRGK